MASDRRFDTLKRTVFTSAVLMIVIFAVLKLVGFRVTLAGLLLSIVLSVGLTWVLNALAARGRR